MSGNGELPAAGTPHEAALGGDFLQFLDNIHDINDPVDLDSFIDDPLPDAAPGLDIDALLDDPLNAALVSAQLSKGTQRPRKAPNTALQPNSTAPPIAKPRRKKVRDRDRLDLLEKHLETVVDQVKLLSIRNNTLHRRKKMLEHMVGTIAHCEALAQQAQLDIAHHKAHPDQPPRGAALYHTWTPQQYIAFYRSQNALASSWMLEADAALGAGLPLPAEALAQLGANHRHVLEVTFHVCQQEAGAFIPHVMTDMLKQFPPSMDEDAHWEQVLEAMQLTEGQVEEVLVAREVFFNIVNRLDHQQEAFKAAIDEGMQQTGQATSFDSVLNMEEDLLAQLDANLRKNTSMAMLLAMSVFLSTLTPVQVAKCALHAHPLFPDPIIILNAIQAKYGQAPGAPQLGPNGLAGLASARTLHASLQLYSTLAAAPPPGLPPATPVAPLSAAMLPSTPRASSSAGSIGPR